jgi:hypothetical protein
MAVIPREARDGLMRAWLEILRERHPAVSWVPVMQECSGNEEVPTRSNASGCRECSRRPL